MNFTDEYAYLLHLLDAALHGAVPQDIPDSLSFDKVLEYGITHEVANMAFAAVEKLSPPPPITERFRKEYWKAVRRDIIQQKARTEILSVLHKEGIATLEVQGTAVKRFYPQPHLRMMSDLDIIVSPAHLQKAGEQLQTLGYAVTLAHGEQEIQAQKNGVFVELHTDFFDSIDAVSAALSHPFDRVIGEKDGELSLSDTDFYLFHLLHTLKHAAEYSGIGIRRIVDLYYLDTALSRKTNGAAIDAVLKEHGFYDLKEELFAVKDHWFCGKDATPKIEAREKEICFSGNHGNEELYYPHLAEHARATGKRFPRLYTYLVFLFPPKEEIYRAYPFCRKHRYPTVLCWCHRGCCSLFSVTKRKNAASAFSHIFKK